MRKVANVIELFAGCGGTSTGLAKAGYRVALGVDHNAAAIDTFKYNHTHLKTRGHVGDVRQVSGAGLLEMAGIDFGDLDILAGGPPCQPFSIIGKMKGMDDERGDLVLEFTRLVKETKPNAFIFENVANFARMDGGAHAEQVMHAVTKSGYSIASGLLDASEYGVPQMRKRFIILGVRGRAKVSLPHPTHGEHQLLGQKPIVTCRDALGDLPDVDTDEALRFHNHEGTTHSPAMIKTLQSLPPGERDPKSHHDRLHPDRPSYTLRAGNGNFSPLRPIHYKYPRVISVRESARIQTFPDDYVWPDDMSRLQQYRQVGNAVPPLLAQRLGEHLASLLGFTLDAEKYGRPAHSLSRQFELSVEERRARRQRYIRGASVGRAI